MPIHLSLSFQPRKGFQCRKENKEFQTTVADQRATQKLLTAALNILKGFYAKKAKAALIQTQQPAGPPPPPGFEAYKKNAAAGGVMGTEFDGCRKAARHGSINVL